MSCVIWRESCPSLQSLGIVQSNLSLVSSVKILWFWIGTVGFVSRYAPEVVPTFLFVAHAQEVHILRQVFHRTTSFGQMLSQQEIEKAHGESHFYLSRGYLLISSGFCL